MKKLLLTTGFLFCTTAAWGQTTSLRYSSSGLVSFAWGDTELLGSGVPSVSQVVLRSGTASTTPLSTQINAAGMETLSLYSWGRVSYRYVSAQNQIRVFVTVTNTSNSILDRITLRPLSLQFPSQPAEYDGSTPISYHNVGGPTVLSLTAGLTRVAIANEDITNPLLVILGPAANSPANTIFPLTIDTGTAGYAGRLPDIRRPIAPGESMLFQISFRFGTPATPVTLLAGEIYAAFAATAPLRYGWTDRRPIGTLFLASSGTNYPSNPRGWFNDPNTDTTTPEGLAAFRTRLMAYADSSIAELRKMDAQGAIIWDIEGEQFPQPVTYLGDPRVLPAVAPEMDALADEFVRRLTGAGFAVGFTMRPQQLVFPADGSVPMQNGNVDPVKTLNDKIEYAKARWGASLFYIDSNGDPNLPIDYKTILPLQGAHPESLLIPEHENMGYYTFSAPYNELRGGVASTPAAVRLVYPTAFSVINTQDGPIESRYNDLVQAVSQGDILMFRGWYDDPANVLVQSIYRAGTGQQ